MVFLVLKCSTTLLILAFPNLLSKTTWSSTQIQVIEYDNSRNVELLPQKVLRTTALHGI